MESIRYERDITRNRSYFEGFKIRHYILIKIVTMHNFAEYCSILLSNGVEISLNSYVKDVPTAHRSTYQIYG